MTDEAQRKVLDMVEQGRISPDEGLQLINALEGDHHKKQEGEDGLTGEVAYIPQEEGQKTSHSIPAEEMARMKRMKRWWVLPFSVGLVVTLLGAIWMYSGYLANGFGWGFWLSWLPFLLGIAIIAVSFPTSKSVWLHVRIKQKPGESPQRINISFPIPLRFAKWGLTTFGDKIPDINGKKAGDFSAILDALSPEEPFYIHIDDEDGEQVEVYIG